MAKKIGGLLDKPWFFHYELCERDDGWWNAIIYAQGNLPLGICEGKTRIEAECRGFNSLMYFAAQEN